MIATRYWDLEEYNFKDANLIYYHFWPSHFMSTTDKSTLLYRHYVIDQQDVKISKNRTVWEAKWEMFGSLALLACNHLGNISSLRSIFMIKAILWVLRTKVHYNTDIGYIIIMWLTNKILRHRRSVRWRGTMPKCWLARSIRSLVIVFWNLSSLYPLYKASYVMSVTKISTRHIDCRLIYDFTTDYFDMDYVWFWRTKC